MRIDVKLTGFAEARAQLAEMSDRRFAAAVATGITRTAAQARQALREELPRAFDRPTPYTLNQARYTPATAQRLWADVGFDIDAIQDARGAVSGYRKTGDTPASKYLAPGVEGGPRNTKRFERAMQAAGYLPTGWVAAPGPAAKIDAWGNISKGQIIQILSQLRVQLVAGTTRNMARPDDKRGAASARAAIKRAGGRYFVQPVGAKGIKQPGVYLRDIGTGFEGASRGQVLLVLAFVRTPTYTRRLDFDGLMRRVADQHLGDNINRALNESLARLKGGA